MRAAVGNRDHRHGDARDERGHDDRDEDEQPGAAADILTLRRRTR